MGGGEIKVGEMDILDILAKCPLANSPLAKCPWNVPDSLKSAGLESWFTLQEEQGEGESRMVGWIQGGGDGKEGGRKEYWGTDGS